VIAPPRSDVNVDLEKFRLRRFLEELDAAGELERHPEPVELAAVAAILEGNPKAVLFERAGREQLPLAGNVMGSRARFARAFGVVPQALLPEVLRRLRTKAEVVELTHDQAPVQEVVMTGDEIDVTALPAHVQHGRDGGPYISAAMDFCIDPATGLTNVGLRRCMVRGRTQTAIDLLAASDLRGIYRAAVARGEGLPLSIVVGGHPVDYLGATMRIPGNEIELLAALRGEPMPVVKSITNDIRVPADAEWVIEGYLGAEGYVEPEGPFGEFLGYYGGMKTNPIFYVTAITRRRDAVFQTVSISGRTMSRTDTAQLTTLRTESLAWRGLENALREPIAVYAPPATGGVYNLRVAIRQRFPGEAHNAIAAVFASLANVKNVFVVDPDIDIYSDEQMEWALATRFQPDRDLIVEGGFRASPLDPSLPPGVNVGSKAGFDLTLPIGAVAGLESSIPEVPRFEGRRFPSVRAALEDGPKFFEELMAAIGSTDGRDVARTLDELRATGTLTRDPDDGRYALKAAP
jgi:2,5-furandicarboxylate decarboxylase 1